MGNHSRIGKICTATKHNRENITADPASLESVSATGSTVGLCASDARGVVAGSGDVFCDKRFLLSNKGDLARTVAVSSSCSESDKSFISNPVGVFGRIMSTTKDLLSFDLLMFGNESLVLS
jgi:hypothetical protein